MMASNMQYTAVASTHEALKETIKSNLSNHCLKLDDVFESGDSHLRRMSMVGTMTLTPNLGTTVHTFRTRFIASGRASICDDGGQMGGKVHIQRQRHVASHPNQEMCMLTR